MNSSLIVGADFLPAQRLAEALAQKADVVVLDDEIQFDFPSTVTKLLSKDVDTNINFPLDHYIVFFDVSDEEGSVARSIYVENQLDYLTELTYSALTSLTPGGKAIFVALNMYGSPHFEDCSRFFEILKNEPALNVDKFYVGSFQGLNWPGMQIRSLVEIDTYLMSLIT
ncbi:MAG: hypothetical protein Q4A31_10765 [Corynebacterium sp.]|uniref:hypothetical protein n=1 Tax=Corynebacterium sp. TaxID=1720 RepID=UPI0026DD8B25|nr:hypothetical protein [Corynebacterium sp.]MDO4762390.1 hypothetical protein [Corynebacterium sp.]